MGNMKLTSPNREYKIKRGARNKMAGPAGQLPEQGMAEGLMGSHFVRRGDPEAYLEKMRKIHKTLVKGGYKPLGYISSHALSKPYQSAHYVHSTNPDTHPDVSVDRVGNQGHILVSMKKSKPVNLPEQGVAEGVRTNAESVKALASLKADKVAKHNAAVAKLPGGQAHRSNHPNLLKSAPKGYSFSVSHKLVPDQQGVSEGSDRIAANKQDRVEALENKLKAKGYARTKDSDGGEYQYRWTRDGAPSYVVNYRSGANGYAEFWKEQGVDEAYNFKGSFPFDVDHMGGTRGINLPSAPTKKFFTDKKQWSQTVDDINSSKYDDNSEYSGTTGRTTVSIDNREWARWSDAQEKGYIEMSSMTEQDISEAHGNYAGDRPVNLGGVSMKKIQIGDTVRYIDQKAQVVDMSRDREHARITIPSSATTKTVLTSDLRPLGRGVSEETLSELSPATLARYKTKAGAAATAADSAGDRRTGDRRFSGIVKATKKQFDQDAKQSAQAVHESRLRLMASIIKTQ
jgi:hypothetical protein